jgi:hypothetical protein
MSSHESYSTEEILDAIHWCRLGRVRPARDGAFHEAKRLGLLAQDSVWRATERGVGALIAAGRMPGAPAPEQITLAMHWAVCPNYPRPQLVRVWTEWAWENVNPTEIEDVELDFRGYGDPEPWEFFTTVERIDAPPVPVPELEAVE